MGYTHYFKNSRAIKRTDWATVSADISAIVNYARHEQGIELRDLGGESGEPEFAADRIAFNGAREESHESFVINRKADSEFCKTDRKPYDLPVTAILCYLASVSETHHVTSDGTGHDWLAGLELAKQALPRYANMLDIPRPILEEDRWCGPWLGVQVPDWHFSMCLDGYAYIIAPDGRSYRFHSHFEAAQWASSHIEKPTTVESWSGSRREGGRSIFAASGAFDSSRINALARQQKAAMANMVNTASGVRLTPPPAFMRPDELAAMDETPRAYSLEALLKLAA